MGTVYHELLLTEQWHTKWVAHRFSGGIARIRETSLQVACGPDGPGTKGATWWLLQFSGAVLV